jgi:hypothetical protein
MPAYDVAAAFSRWGRDSLGHRTDDERGKAVTKATATREGSSSRAVKTKVLNELCELTGWHRDHAAQALREALGPRRVPAPRKARAPVYGEDVMVALRKVWAVMDVPAGKGDGTAPVADRGPATGLWCAGRVPVPDSRVGLRVTAQSSSPPTCWLTASKRS